MTELRDKSVLHEAQTHLEAYKRGEEWAKKDFKIYYYGNSNKSNSNPVW